MQWTGLQRCFSWVTCVCRWQMKPKRPFSLKAIQPNSERVIMWFAPKRDVIGVDMALSFFFPEVYCFCKSFVFFFNIFQLWRQFKGCCNSHWTERDDPVCQTILWKCWIRDIFWVMWSGWFDNNMLWGKKQNCWWRICERKGKGI